MKRFSLRYTLMTSKLDQLWFPFAIFGLFVIISGIMKDTPQFLNAARGYLGVAIPLVAGIMSAYAILEDPAIELRFATPIRELQTLSERLGLVFVIQAATALVYQLVISLLGANFSMYASFLQLQLAWLIPTLSLMMFGCFCALLAANSVVGSLMVGLVWLVELIGREWFAQNFGKYFLVFMGSLMNDHPDLTANFTSLIITSAALFALSLVLLHRQERYI